MKGGHKNKKILSTLFAILICVVSVGEINADALSSKAPMPIDSVYQIEDMVIAEDIYVNGIQSAAASLTLTNRRLVDSSRYYSNEPADGYTFYNAGATPITVSWTPSVSGKAGYDGNNGVTQSMITSAFGVDFSKTYTFSNSTYSQSVPAKKTIAIKAFVMYSLYTFDVYNGNQYVGESSYWIPNGIYVTHSIT